MKAELIGVHDPRWQDLLSQVLHDFYHLPDYAALSAREEGGTALALYVVAGADRLLLPLVARPIPAGGEDVSSPYGYPGPLISGDAAPGFLAAALRAGVEVLAQAGYVSLFVRMHPLLCPEAPDRVGTVVRHAPTVVIDLEEDDETWFASMRKSHRQQIRRALDEGHRVHIDEDWQHFDFFRRTYHETMERLAAGKRYYFSDSYFDALRSALGDRLRLFVIEYGDRPWAGGLFVETCGIVQSHLSADDGSFRRGGAKKLLYAGVREWASSRDDRWFHLGGGAALEPGLLSFKKGFSRDHRPFETLRVVLREEAYRGLVGASERPGHHADASGFFPAYRKDH
jgi:hypothetical protein